MVNKIQKGNYYRLKTKHWLESEGYLVEKIERRIPIPIIDKITGQKKVVFVARDLFGADLVAMNKKEIIFIQCKTHASDVLDGMNKLLEYPYPPLVKRWVARWIPGAKEPTITEVPNK